MYGSTLLKKQSISHTCKVIIGIKLRIMKCSYKKTEEGTEDSKKRHDAVTVFMRHCNSS